VQALILAPTRELSLQIAFVVNSIGEYMHAQVGSFTGGTLVKDDIHKLTKTIVHVAVGTPGRIHDLMKRGLLKTEYLKILVLDEADEMLSFGFAEQIK
jgi:translation initiation factor 4A